MKRRFDAMKTDFDAMISWAHFLIFDLQKSDLL